MIICVIVCWNAQLRDTAQDHSLEILISISDEQLASHCIDVDIMTSYTMANAIPSRLNRKACTMMNPSSLSFEHQIWSLSIVKHLSLNQSSHISVEEASS